MNSRITKRIVKNYTFGLSNGVSVHGDYITCSCSDNVLGASNSVVFFLNNIPYLSFITYVRYREAVLARNGETIKPTIKCA